MKSIKLGFLLPLACLPAACGQEPRVQDQNKDRAPSTAAVAAATNPGTRPRDGNSAHAGNGVDDGYPDLSPPVLTAETERSAKGARNVLISFARAIELREYGQAWAMLSPTDQQKWSRPAFAEMFTDLDDILVAMPDGTMEGAAGSSYYTAPITITAMEPTGRPTRMEGTAVLRRVNDIEGASQEQLRWHFESVILSSTH